MNGRFLLDTNIVIAIFANDPATRQSLIEANEVFVTKHCIERALLWCLQVDSCEC